MEVKPTVLKDIRVDQSRLTEQRLAHSGLDRLVAQLESREGLVSSGRNRYANVVAYLNQNLCIFKGMQSNPNGDT